MTGKSRKKRPTLQRSAPIRGWTGMFGGDARHPGEDTADRIGNGVGLGYRVIDEYIQLGRNAAQAFSAAMPRGWGVPPPHGNNTGGAPPPWPDFFGSPPFDPGGPMGRSMGGPMNGPPDPMQMYGDLAGMWMQAWQQWMSWYGPLGNGPQAPDPAASRDGPPPFEATQGSGTYTADSPPSHAADPTESDDLRVRVRVETSQLTDCAVDLSAGSDSLVLHELRATDPALPRISDCGISREHEEWVVRISIPEGQPEAFYSGVIVDEASSLPRGSVWVRIGNTQAPTSQTGTD
jgi:hypothetical protein